MIHDVIFDNIMFGNTFFVHHVWHCFLGSVPNRIHVVLVGPEESLWGTHLFDKASPNSLMGVDSRMSLEGDRYEPRHHHK